MTNVWLKIIGYLNGFLLLSSTYCMITEAFHDGKCATFLYGLIYFPIVVILSICEKKVKHFWQYLLGVIVTLGMAYYISGPGFLKFWMVFLTVFAAVSFFLARSRQTECWLDVPAYPYLLLFLIMYFWGIRFESRLLKNYAMFGAGIYYLLCIYRVNILQMSVFVENHSSLERFPVKRMKQSNGLMMGLQTVVVAIGMCAAPFAGLEEWIYTIGRMLRDMLAWLLRGLEAGEIQETAQQAEQQMEAAMPQVEGEISFWLILLYKIMDIMSWVLAIGFSLCLIYFILKKLYQMYQDFNIRSEETGDRIEQIYMAPSEEEKRQIKRQKKENLFWDRSANARIRKFYKKRVLKEWGFVPESHLTPEELEQGISMEMAEKEIFHSCYEKARYGQEPCSREEMQKMLHLRS